MLHVLHHSLKVDLAAANFLTMPHYLIFGGGPEFCRAAGQKEEGGRTADVRCKVVQRIFERSNYLYRVCTVNRDLA